MIDLLKTIAAVVAAIAVSVSASQAPAPHVPDCHEDENWVAVDYRTRDAVEDIHGVSRACRHADWSPNRIEDQLSYLIEGQLTNQDLEWLADQIANRLAEGN